MFLKPVFVNETIDGIAEVKEINFEKKLVSFETKVIKSNEIVVKGYAKLIIPTLIQ